MPDPADSGRLVLDTSVWINLLATEAIEPILIGLGCEFHAPEQVLAEVKRHPITNASLLAETHPLRTLGVSIIALDAAERRLFLDIVGAPAADALGDGEAAAIAVAVSRGLDLVIDDRKARRILRERFADVRVYWTVDLLRSPAVIQTLGARLSEERFARASRFGRMHIPRG